MKQKTVKFVCSSNSYTHTHTKLLRVVKFCVIMAMFLSYSYQAKSQSNGYDDQIVGPASAVENQIVNYATAAYVQQSNCHPIWTISGGTIIGSATSHNIAVKWLNGGTTGTLSFSTWGCTGLQVACCQELEVTVTNYVPPPVVISGRVTTNCGIGVPNVNINLVGKFAFQGTNFSVVTNNYGYYSVTVPYSYSSTISASRPTYSFSASQNYTNTTADRTLNFLVIQSNSSGPSLGLYWDGEYATIIGMVPGFKYDFYRTERATGMTNSFEVDTDFTQVQISRTVYSQVCIKLKCSSQALVCTQ